MTFYSGPKGPFADIKASVALAIDSFFPRGFLSEFRRRGAQILGTTLAGLAIVILLSIISFAPDDPSLNTASNMPPENWLKIPGAIIADLCIQTLGFVGYLVPLFLFAWAWSCLFGRAFKGAALRFLILPISLILLAAVCSALPISTQWSKPLSAGGAVGELALAGMQALVPMPKAIWAMISVVIGGCLYGLSLPLTTQELHRGARGSRHQKNNNWRESLTRSAGSEWRGNASQLAEAGFMNDASLFEYNDPSVIQQILTASDNGSGYVPDAERDDRVSETVIADSPLSNGHHPALRETSNSGEGDDKDDASDFEGAAYGATRYSMNFGNEAVNWSGLTSFAQATESQPNNATDDGVPEWKPDLWQNPKPVSVAHTQSPPSAPNDPNTNNNDNPAFGAQIEPERQQLTSSFVNRLKAEELRREPNQAATSDDTDLPSTANVSDLSFSENDTPASGDPTDEALDFDIATTPATNGLDDDAIAPTASLDHAANAVDQQLGGALAANRKKQIRIQKKSRAALDRHGSYNNWQKPTVDFLDLPDASHIVGLSEQHISDRISQLETALAEFNVKGEVLRARPGPVVTLFEFQPAPGTRISRIVSLSDDIKRAMASASCRIAVVPETTLIGIELPNKQRTPVNLRQIIDSESFTGSKAKLPLAMGIDISGQPVIGDLARCPHLLIAGTTGAGKSVSLNGMIMSMLYKLPPDKLKMIMIDPKMLELSIYDKIPHLLSPVVTDPRKAIVALKWAVREMEERYATMMTLQVRGIVDYNERIQKAIQQGEVLTRDVQTGFNIETGKPEFEEQELPLKPMPYIVCIIDELADLMELAKKEIEGSLQRLTQMGRAAGIHVITATQRPSVDVITGVIKANIPSRVSLYVRSKTDSRIVLDEQGAEQLLRVGDMLYSAEGRRPSRVHSGYVSTDEVLAVVEHLKAQAEPEYIDAIQDDSENEGNGSGDLFGDYASDDGSGGSDGDLYRQAVRIVCQDRRASTSYIQRKLQIGYNRAARLIEQMETEGIVGPADKVGRRDILVGGDD